MTNALSVSAFLIALLSIAMPVEAGHYYGTLLAAKPFSITIDAATVNAKTIITVSYLSGGRAATEEQEAKLGKGIKFDLLTVAPNERRVFVQTVPKGTRAIVIDVAPPRFQTFNFEIAQTGGGSFPETCVDGCTFTFDVE